MVDLSSTVEERVACLEERQRDAERERQNDAMRRDPWWQGKRQ